MQAADVLFQLLARAGLGKNDAADVVIEIDVVVIDPYRIGQFEGHQRELALEHGGQMHAAGHVCLHVLVEIARVPGREIEDVETTHMHGHLG